MMDACAGPMMLANQRITADQILNGGMSARLRFSTPTPLGGVEVRLLVDGELTVGIASLEIFGERLDGENWTLESSDLPTPRVDNAIRHGRNLFEGYQRGLAVTTQDRRARIAWDPDFRRARELAGNRTIVSEAALWNIFLLMKFYVPKLSFGHVVEFGCYKGGSAIFMAALAAKFLPGARVIGFDTFSGMPATDLAVDAHAAGGFADVDLAELRDYAEKSGLSNLTYVQGRFEETARPALVKLEKVALCHIDCDIRSSVEFSYNSVKPYMTPGGYWVFDDLHAADCLGAVEAVEDLLIKRDGLNSEQRVPHEVFREPFDEGRSSGRTRTSRRGT
jgi:SAM-dependent methyltransferase